MSNRKLYSILRKCPDVFSADVVTQDDLENLLRFGFVCSHITPGGIRYSVTSDGRRFMMSYKSSRLIVLISIGSLVASVLGIVVSLIAC